MHTTVGEHIDSAVQQVFQVLRQRDDIEKGATRLHVDEEIDVTPRAGLITCGGTEHADPPSPVFSRKADDAVAVCVEELLHG